MENDDNNHGMSWWFWMLTSC